MILYAIITINYIYDNNKLLTWSYKQVCTMYYTD